MMSRLYFSAAIVPLLVSFAMCPVQAAGNAQYDRCLARAQTDGMGALAEAAAWAKSGGGGAADHCAAIALVTLRRFSEAAQRLDTLARSPFATDAAMRTALFDQAGNAWLLSSRSDSAIASFSAALAIDPLDADLLADRARAFALKRNWAKAESDLTAALMVAPERADLLVLRGSARNAMGRRPDARADFDAALRIQPRNADALVERGVVRLQLGDSVGARADWQAAISTAPGSAAAQSAQQHLADTTPQ